MTDDNARSLSEASLDLSTEKQPDSNSGGNTESTGLANAVYIMYLVGIVFQLVALIAVIMAFANINARAEWINKHHRFQLRTFWMGILYAVIIMALVGLSRLLGFPLFALIGFLGMVVQFIWFLVRTIRGMRDLAEGREPKNWQTWGF